MSLNSVRKKKWGKNKQTRFTELSENVASLIAWKLGQQKRATKRAVKIFEGKDTTRNTCKFSFQSLSFLFFQICNY